VSKTEESHSVDQINSMKETGKGGKRKTKKQKGILIDSLNYYSQKANKSH